ncbi:MAG: hypothetical protein MJE66_05745 [Proteobacteria bacterium]|nr:hypothetical protein [Pseudomonadota bacterium]
MSEPDDPPQDWKLKLRYGQLETPYRHFTTVSDGVFSEPSADFECPAGPAVMSMRVWASDTNEAADMACTFGDQIGFAVTGSVQIYDSEPEQPPRDDPFGYAIQFTPYDPDA